MADKWLNDYIEIELQKAEYNEQCKRGEYVLNELMKPTQEGDLEDCVEDGFNIY